MKYILVFIFGVTVALVATHTRREVKFEDLLPSDADLESIDPSLIGAQVENMGDKYLALWGTNDVAALLFKPDISYTNKLFDYFLRRRSSQTDSIYFAMVMSLDNHRRISTLLSSNHISYLNTHGNVFTDTGHDGVIDMKYVNNTWFILFDGAWCERVTKTNTPGTWILHDNKEISVVWGENSFVKVEK